MANFPTPRDLHQQITDQIVTAIEQGPGLFVLPWRQSFGIPTNALSRNPYSGINILSLWTAALQRGFASPIWATYKQWAALGAQVGKGERATLVVFYKDYTATPNPDDAEDTGRRRVARASFVFNAEQVTGYAAAAPTPPLPPIQRLRAADTFINATQASILYGGDRAFYRPSTDQIQMPAEHLFEGTPSMERREAFYATLLHELVHWTGAKHRLDRQLGQRFGSEAYAAEELVAELGAAFLCSEVQITPGVRTDHAQYLASWLTLLKQDSRAILTAASKASEATRFLHALNNPAVAADSRLAKEEVADA